MKNIEIWYNPYRLETRLLIDGKEPKADSVLQYAVAGGKRLQEWISRLPKDLCEECGCREFTLKFHGMVLDWDDVQEAFDMAKKRGEIGNVARDFVESPSDEEIKNKITDIFHDLQNGPIDAFRDEQLVRAFNRMLDNKFPVNVIATMSSGKSTLINSLLGVKLMPAKNEACTATITEILDLDKDTFSAEVFDKDGALLKTVRELSYEIMDELNADPDVSRIYAEGDIPFLDAHGTQLMLVDTPGPNNSRDASHRQTTYSAIANGSNNLILYVLNGTQLSTNDDCNLLTYVAEQIKKGGKQTRDRFLFVINKMDQFDPDNEDIGKAVQAARDYLGNFGIEDPQIYPCSAFTALNIRTYLKDIDIENLTRAEERQLPKNARDTIAAIDTFIDCESMHLEQYSTLTPSAQRKLQERLKRAVEAGDAKEQALVHSGILSVEEAINAYVKKYAMTKLVKDLVERMEKVLETQQVFANAKAAIAENEEYAKQCRERAEKIQTQIQGGEESAKFRRKVDALDPVAKIQEKADETAAGVASKMTEVFGNAGYSMDYEFTDAKEARRFVEKFSKQAEDLVYPMGTDLTVLIDEEIRKKGMELLNEYKQYLNRVDENAGGSLEFRTSDLIGDKIQMMEDIMADLTNTSYAISKVEETGETYQEEETYLEKVGTREIQVKTGSHQEKVGTKTVKVGSHRERVGTQTVRNNERSWWQIWKPKYIEKDVYQTVDEYEEQDIYVNVDDYKTEKQDIIEERTRMVERFRLPLLKLQGELMSDFQDALNESIQTMMESAKEQAENMRSFFQQEFDKLDEIIQEKYNDLLSIDSEQEEYQQAADRNKAICAWLEANLQEIHDTLDLKED